MANLARFPIQPLDYNYADKRMGKELIINYDTGDIYVSAVDKTLIDVTSVIKDKLKDFDGNKMELDIDGIGKITLNKLLVDIISKVDNMIEVTDVGTNDFEYYKDTDKIDGISIESESSIIQIKGFNVADNYKIPRKSKNGEIEWVSIVDILQNEKDQIRETNPPIDPLDGKIYQVDELYADIDKIYLRVDRRQKTINPQETQLNIVLPTIVDEYAKIEWLLSLGNNVPIVKFDSTNTKVQQDGVVLSANNTYLYTIETYDFGACWLCHKRMFAGSYDLTIHES